VDYFLQVFDQFSCATFCATVLAIFAMVSAISAEWSIATLIVTQLKGEHDGQVTISNHKIHICRFVIGYKLASC